MKEGLIQCGAAVMMGLEAVAGTRITVELILEKLGKGGDSRAIAPGASSWLTREGIQAALSFAAESLNA